MRRKAISDWKSPSADGAGARTQRRGSPQTRMRAPRRRGDPHRQHPDRYGAAPPSSSLIGSPVETSDMLIGALLRVPAQAIQRRIIKELNAAGFGELRVPHMAVLQYPGPDGVRPGVLAERAGMSKQAMNQLLRSLEGLGYIVRSDAPDEGRARIIRLTKRGRAAYSRISDILRDIEREWSAELGPERFAQLKEVLFCAWESQLTR
jgi:DNA-binding MarR family transcriptional regulator